MVHHTWSIGSGIPLRLGRVISDKMYMYMYIHLNITCIYTINTCVYVHVHVHVYVYGNTYLICIYSMYMYVGTFAMTWCSTDIHVHVFYGSTYTME